MKGFGAGWAAYHPMGIKGYGSEELRDVLWVSGLAGWAGYEAKVSVLYWMDGQQGVVSS